MTRDHFTDPPARRIGALCCIRNSDGGVLLMNRRRNEGEPAPWGLPGGCAEEDQDVRSECARIVKEKVGIDIRVGRLLSVHHMPEKEYEDHISKEGINFVFDGGVLSDPSFTLGPTISEARFVQEEALGRFLASYNEDRMVAALGALGGDEVKFLRD